MNMDAEIKMKLILTDEEKECLKFFELNEDFSLAQLRRAYDKAMYNRYPIAFEKDYTIDQIDSVLKQAYDTLYLCLCKRMALHEVIKLYFVELKIPSVTDTLNADKDLSKGIIVNDVYYDFNNPDVGVFVSTYLKHLNSFNKKLSLCTNKEQIKKLTDDYFVTFELDKHGLETGKLGNRDRMLKSLKDKIITNFEVGSDDYQDMIDNYGKLLTTKNYDKFVRKYDLMVIDINRRIVHNDLERQLKNIKK